MTPSNEAAVRRHDIDALRVFAFALLMLYHASGIWQADSSFPVTSMHRWEHMDALRIVFNRWRMPLLFALSGMAIALAAPRSAMTMAWRRSRRLLLPLVVGMFTTIAVQAYLQSRWLGTVEPGLLSFWLRYMQVRPWPEAGFSGSAHGITWMHLWYLAYLWCYTMLLLALRPLLGCEPLRRIGALLARFGLIAGWLLPVLAWLAVLLWLVPRYPENHALTGDWYAHAVYFSCFLAGWLIARTPAVWDWLVRWRWLTLCVALLAITLELALKLSALWLPDGPLPVWAVQVNWRVVERAARACYGWTALLTIFGFAHRHLNRPFRWLPYANEAVYPWYILHQTVLVVMGFIVLPLGWSAGAEVGVILGGTVVGCAVLHEWLIRRAGWLRPLFGLRSTTRQRSVTRH